MAGASIKEKVVEIQAEEKEVAITAIVEKIIKAGESASSLGVEDADLLIKNSIIYVADLNRLKEEPGLFDGFKAVLSVNVRERFNRVNSDSTILYIMGKDLTDGQLLRVLMEIDNPAMLTGLFLQGNQLTTLPDSIGRLVKLKYLHLKGNPLPKAEIENICAFFPTVCTTCF